MVGLQILLLCVSMHGLEVLADKDIQPYGPQMCKSLCSRLNCSDSIFYEVKLMCKLHFPTELRDGTLPKFNKSKAATAEPKEVALPEFNKSNVAQAGFFVQTMTKLYHFDNSLRQHVTTLRGLPRLRLTDIFFVYERRSLYAFAKGKLYVAAFNKYTSYFQKTISIKALKNLPIENLALDLKNKVLATIYATSRSKMTLGLFSLERSNLFRALVKEYTKVTNLCIDKQNRLVFYISTNEYISSIDYKGQTTTKYGRAIRHHVIKFEAGGETITWYTCFESQPVRSRYDMRSKKTTRKKFDRLRPCFSTTSFIIVGDKIVKDEDVRNICEIKNFVTSIGIRYPEYETIASCSGIVVEGRESIKRFLLAEIAVRMFKLN